MNKKHFFMKLPFLRKIFYRFWRKIIFTLLLFNIFFISISTQLRGSESHSTDDISIFVENLMIRESGIYTLLGSKPMTEFNITETLELTEEEMAQNYEDLAQYLEEEKHDKKRFRSNIKNLPDYEEYKKTYIQNRDDLYFLNTKKIWDTWIKEQGTLSTPLFKLTFREGHYTTGLFVNVFQIQYVLKKHQKEFSQLTGISFDPNTILDSIEDKSSVFWDKVFKNHYLHGLLLGFGEKNAFLFAWMREKSLPFDLVSMVRFPELSRLDQCNEIAVKKDITIHDLPLPYFVSFEILDAEVERYRKEREKIIHFLKDKDFIPFVLNCLSIK